jgi:hypothetical protein
MKGSSFPESPPLDLGQTFWRIILTHLLFGN